MSSELNDPWDAIRREAEVFSRAIAKSEKKEADEWDGYEKRLAIKKQKLPDRRRSSEGWVDGRKREFLPIDARLWEIHELLEKNQVVIVEAETGAGKTTRICQFELLANEEQGILMTQTRRNAVRWNGKRIAEEMGSRPGGTVGWRLFGEDPKVSADTRLTLVVDQSLSNKVRRDGCLPPGLLIIDEAHERSIPTDLLLGLIKEYLPKSPNTKILITSATIDTKKFSQFFNEAPSVSVIGRCYPVTTTPRRLTKYEHHSQGAGFAARDVIDAHKAGELFVPSEDGSKPETVNEGIVLVLLPGVEDIKNVVKDIRYKIEAQGAQSKVEVCICHGQSTVEEQDAIHAPLKPGMLRFVVGTEVLRSSITVENTIGVIDSLQVKRLISDPQGVGHLDKIAVSKAEASQGRGRAGRTRPGFYIPVSFGDEYEQLDPYPTPAILQQPISNVILQVASIGRSARDFAFIDPLPKEKLEVAIKRLQRLDALDADEKITPLGEILVQFPLDPERAKSLVIAEKLGVLPETIIAVSFQRNIFFKPNDEKKEWIVEESVLRQLLTRFMYREGYSYRPWAQRSIPILPAEVDLSVLPSWAQKVGRNFKIVFTSMEFPGNEGVETLRKAAIQTLAQGGQSDIATQVHAFRAYKRKEEELAHSQPPQAQQGEKRLSPYEWRRKELMAWCERWFINQKLLSDSERVMQEIVDEVKNSSLTLDAFVTEERPFDSRKLTMAFAGGMIDNVAVSSGNGFASPLVRDQTFQLGRESVCDPASQIIICGGVRKIPTRRQSFFYLGEVAAPITLEELKEVAPQLCTTKLLPNEAISESNEGVVQTQTTLYGSLVVSEQWVPAVRSTENARKFAYWFSRRPSIQFVRNPEIQEVLRANQELITRTQSLLRRMSDSSSSTLNQYSAEKIEEYYTRVLAGAQSVAEIPDPKALILPPPDPQELAKIEKEYPDSLEIIGKSLKISYEKDWRTGVIMPTVLIPIEDPKKLLAIPTEPIIIPSGQTVKVSLGFQIPGVYIGQSITGATTSEAVATAISTIENMPFRSLLYPENYSLGDTSNPETAVPQVYERVYGRKIADDSPLIGYAALRLFAYGNSFTAEVQWFREKQQAENARNASVLVITRSNELKQEQEKLGAEMTRLNDVRDQISREIYRTHEKPLPLPVFERARNFLYEQISYTAKFNDVVEMVHKGEKLLAFILDPSVWPTSSKESRSDSNSSYEETVDEKEPSTEEYNPFREFAKGRDISGEKSKRPEKPEVKKEPVAPKKPVERNLIMTEQLRQSFSSRISEALFILGAGRPDKKEDTFGNRDEREKARKKIDTAREEIGALLRDLPSETNPESVESKVQSAMKRAEKIVTDMARAASLNPEWVSKLRAYEMMAEGITVDKAEEWGLAWSEDLRIRLQPELTKLAQRRPLPLPSEVEEGIEQAIIETI
jgi:HrpA-like RNA helicase